MPNRRSGRQAVYIPTGNPDTMNVLQADYDLQAPGELGLDFGWNDRGYQIVKHDSGATSATGVGVAAANQLAYWKDRVKYLVTNDSAQAIGGGANAWRNQVAGVYRSAVTAGRVVCVLQTGDNVPVKGTGTIAAGETIIANSGTAADVTSVAVGTAPTYLVLGIARGAVAGGNVNVDLNIPAQP